METLIDEPLAQSGLKRNYFGICELQKKMRGVNEEEVHLVRMAQFSKTPNYTISCSECAFRSGEQIS